VYFAFNGEVIIGPEKFGEIKTALAAAGLIALTTYEVKSVIIKYFPSY